MRFSLCVKHKQNIAKKLGLKFIWALSLPGKIAPVTSAEFIKNTVYNILDELA